MFLQPDRPNVRQTALNNPARRNTFEVGFLELPRLNTSTKGKRVSPARVIERLPSVGRYPDILL
jgi:hypothetical protein